MDSPYRVISGFVTALEEAAGDLAPKGIQWKVIDGRLQFTPLPAGLIPNYLALEPLRRDEDWLASNDALGVIHVTDEGDDGAELGPETRERVVGLADLAIDAATPSLAEALDSYSEVNAPVAGITRVDLVVVGHLPAASVFLKGRPGELEELTARVGWVGASLSVDDPVARLLGDEMGEFPIVYCAMSAAEGEAMRALEARLAGGGDFSSGDLDTLGRIRGVPRCCVDAFDTGLLQVPSRRVIAVWLDVFLAAAGRAGASPVTVFPPSLNFIAASLYQLFFFEHLPCGPACVATMTRNERALETLYGPEDAALVREMLSSSFICWPDGRLVPFRVERVEGDTVIIADLGRLRWPDHMAAERRTLLQTGIGGADGGAGIDALRWSGSSCEAREDGRWHRLRERGRWFRSVYPAIALFGEIPTRR